MSLKDNPTFNDSKKLRAYKWLIKLWIRKYIYKRQNSINENSSKYVVFRLDDVGFDAKDGQIAVMDLFLKRSQRVSLGLVMNHIEKDRSLLERIQFGFQKGLFELALHGWDHVDYSTLDEKKQEILLRKAYEKMDNLFGMPSKVFIPPYDSFNGSTLQAMNSTGIKIISSALSYEIEKHVFTTFMKSPTSCEANLIYHVPEMSSFERWDKHYRPIRIPIKSILRNIYSNIYQYGYAVITLHPVTFVKWQNGKSSDIVDKDQITDLGTIIDSIKSKNITITSFSKITGIE
jgi:peptidoglycan/xylan/chitin deacetylase (PgdA/CDA1 family)